jgi:hypothetical protein
MKKRIVMVVLACMLLVEAYANHEERKVEPFTGVSLRLEATLYVEQGEKQKVEITAKPETLERIVTEVKNGLLIIRYTRTGGKFEPGPVGIKVTMPVIAQLNMAANGMFYSEKPIESDTIVLSLSGSGELVVNGSGKATGVQIQGTGSGHFIASDFETDAADVRINGSGDVRLTVHETLKARIVGPGDIRYRGNPEVESSITGSGAVRKVD